MKWYGSFLVLETIFLLFPETSKRSSYAFVMHNNRKDV